PELKIILAVGFPLFLVGAVFAPIPYGRIAAAIMSRRSAVANNAADGHPVPDMDIPCQVCGVTIPAGSMHCSKCGAPRS
ncbi:MAG TPA: hypothetical protein VG815_19180, partial [Chloroflexota bacterium]|nr:hypothetical protein [Chloroflexota bacterium]